MKYVIISRFAQTYLCHYLAPGAANLAHMVQSNIYFLLTEQHVSDHVAHMSSSSLGHKRVPLLTLPDV